MASDAIHSPMASDEVAAGDGSIYNMNNSGFLE